MIVMTPEATEAEIAAVRKRLETTGVHVLVLPGELTTAIGAIGDPEGVRELVTKGAGGTLIFATDDCRATYERLRERGVEFTQEPVERFYGTDCALRDPFGNHIRITERAPEPIVPPSETASA